MPLAWSAASSPTPAPFSGGDIGAVIASVLMGFLCGAVGGGLLGRSLERKFAGDQRKLNWIAGLPWIGLGLFVMGAIAFETSRN